MRQIATFSGATITGLNNNAYQITRGEFHNKREGVRTCSFLKADFMNIQVEARRLPSPSSRAPDRTPPNDHALLSSCSLGRRIAPDQSSVPRPGP